MPGFLIDQSIISTMDWLIYAVAGVLSGFLGGLLGIGGGLVIVPGLLLVFSWQEIAPEVATHLAIGSSFGTILLTSMSSIFAHHQRRNVHWEAVKPLAIGMLAGTALGVALVTQVASDALQTIIGIYAAIMALRTLGSSHWKQYPFPSKPVLAGSGVAVGFISSWFGIGGGTLTVPLLTRWQLTTVRAVGTAAACSFPIALSASLSNIYLGWSNPLLPESAWGFFYPQAVIAMACFSVPSARLGAQVATWVSDIALQRLFALFLISVSIRFLLFAE